MLTIEIKSFNDLTKCELYDLLQLRSEVFVVEQNCVYQDIDGKDEKAIHILGIKKNKIVAYSRIFKPGDYFDLPSIGRVVVAKEQRKYGYGHDIVKASIKEIEENFNVKKIHISAQKYLKNFYESHGFIQLDDEYLEDGIPHIKMIKN